MDNNLRLEMESLVTTENVSLYFFLPKESHGSFSNLSQTQSYLCQTLGQCDFCDETPCLGKGTISNGACSNLLKGLDGTEQSWTEMD